MTSNPATSRPTPTLAVIGAGPKAIAVAAKAAELRAAGAVFHTWETLDDGAERIRLVMSFLTPAEDVDRFLETRG